MAAFVEQLASGEFSRLVFGASPRATGRSAALARRVAAGLLERHPGDGLSICSLANAQVNGCIGCDRCRETGLCFQEDDCAAMDALLAAADELHLVCPVYFAGPPSQFKAVLDRMQPHYWEERRPSKRPAYLYVVGEGGDPYGFQPLVTICRSALSLAGFEVKDVYAHIGKDANVCEVSEIECIEGRV